MTYITGWIHIGERERESAPERERERESVKERE